MLNRFWGPPRGELDGIADERHQDLSDALTQIALLMARPLRPPCLDGDIPTPPQCEVSEFVNYRQDDQYEVQIAQCDDDVGSSATNQPCWQIFDDPACSEFPSSLTVRVFPEERSVPTGTHLVVRCLAR